MFGDGLEKEVIITILPRVQEVAPSMFSAGGIVEHDYERLAVWANKGLAKNFERIPGVLKVEGTDTGYKYFLCVDPRYNLKWVMAEIEAVAKTEKPIKPREAKPIGFLHTFTFEIENSAGKEDKPKRKKRAVKKAKK